MGVAMDAVPAMVENSMTRWTQRSHTAAWSPSPWRPKGRSA